MTSLPVPLTPQNHLLKKVSFKKIKRIIALNSLLLLLFGLLWSTTASAALENIKLNAPLTLDGNVSFFAISPDSSRVVYIADQDTDEVFELYSVPVGGGTVTKLNAPFTTDGEVFAFLISPDSSRVIYLADQDSDTVNELYSVPLGGGTVTKLNDPLTANGDIFSFLISPDSGQVVYEADQDSDTVNELYSVSVGGGTVTKLNDPLTVNGDILSFLISPDSSQVVYQADQDNDTVNELYSVPLGGGIVTKLNALLVTNGDVQFDFTISPDSSRVVYRADQDSDTVNELYSVPLGGGIVTKLNALLVTNGDVQFDFAISPDSNRVVYVADQDTDNISELYSVSLGGGTVTKLNNPLPLGGEVEFDFAISPDSSRVVYVADQETDEIFELYSVPLAGGPVIKLNTPLLLNSEVVFFLISPDSSRVAYLADQETDEVFELYSVPLTGGLVTKLNDPLPLGGEVFDFAISPDSSRVVYVADQGTDEIFELYDVSLDGGQVTKLNGSLVVEGDVDSPFVEEGFFAISPDSSRVVYLADQDTDEVIELYTSRQVFPDLTLTKGNSTNGSVSVNTPFTWTLTFSNTGLATADFSDGQTLLTDALPDSGASYGLPLVQNAVNVTGTVDCALSGNDLNCAAAGAVSLAATTGQFQIAVRVTPTIVITLQNPRSGGVCQVDPNGVVAESNESNNTCNADTIVVNKADTIITIDSDSPDPSLVGQPYTVTVTVTSAGGTPEGTVAVNDGAGNTCTITLIGGTGSCLLTSTNVGSKNVTATYNGSTIFNGSSDIESHLVTDKSGLIRQYLPLVLKTQFQPPDLVVNSVLASSNAVTVVIQNQGQDPVNDAFWVEVYVNPTMPPTGPNQEWHKVGSEVGLVWGIVDLPISAGQSITLTLNNPSFAPNQSSPLPVVIMPGSQVYAQVDSANTGVATGAVLETDETNNIVGPVISTVQRGPEPVVSNIEIFIEGLPPRE